MGFTQYEAVIHASGEKSPVLGYTVGITTIDACYHTGVLVLPNCFQMTGLPSKQPSTRHPCFVSIRVCRVSRPMYVFIGLNVDVGSTSGFGEACRGHHARGTSERLWPTSAVRTRL